MRATLDLSNRGVYTTVNRAQLSILHMNSFRFHSNLVILSSFPPLFLIL